MTYKRKQSGQPSITAARSVGAVCGAAFLLAVGYGPAMAAGPDGLRQDTGDSHETSTAATTRMPPAGFYYRHQLQKGEDGQFYAIFANRHGHQRLYACERVKQWHGSGNFRLAHGVPNAAFDCRYPWL